MTSASGGRRRAIRLRTDGASQSPWRLAIAVHTAGLAFVPSPAKAPPPERVVSERIALIRRTPPPTPRPTATPPPHAQPHVTSPPAPDARTARRRSESRTQSGRDAAAAAGRSGCAPAGSDRHAARRDDLGSAFVCPRHAARPTERRYRNGRRRGSWDRRPWRNGQRHRRERHWKRRRGQCGTVRRRLSITGPGQLPA